MFNQIPIQKKNTKQDINPSTEIYSSLNPQSETMYLIQCK